MRGGRVNGAKMCGRKVPVAQRGAERDPRDAPLQGLLKAMEQGLQLPPAPGPDESMEFVDNRIPEIAEDFMQMEAL